MDNTQFGSIAIAQHKARAAATFKRPTKAFADAIAASPANVALLSLDGIIASEGGIPLMRRRQDHRRDRLQRRHRRSRTASPARPASTR